MLFHRGRSLAGFRASEEMSVGNGGVVENVAPVREWRVGRDDGGFLLTVPGGNHPIKEIGGLLVEGQIT